MVVQAYLTMLPRLDAGERLDAIGDQALASGNLPRASAMRAFGQLEEALRGERRRPLKASPAVLAAMGIGIVSVPSASPKAGVNDD